jgi:pimeloyl-ACP methyl ester carboxylesterase
MARARQRLASRSQVAQTVCGPIEYATSGEGIPVLEVHGIFGGFDQGLLVARPVLDEGFRIIAPSRFGYLGTPLPPDVSPASQADAYVCLLDYLGIARAPVMSHSAGTPSAIQLALRHPHLISALVLMVPSAPGPGPMAPPKPVMRALFQTDFVIWFLAAFFPSSLPIGVPTGLELTTDDRAEISRMIETMLPARLRRDGFLFDMFVSTPTIHSGYPFGDISVSTLVVTAADDPLASAENARRLPRPSRTRICSKPNVAATCCLGRQTSLDVRSHGSSASTPRPGPDRPCADNRGDAGQAQGAGAQCDRPAGPHLPRRQIR